MSRWKHADDVVKPQAAYMRKWGQTEKGQANRAQAAARAKKWRENNPERKKATQKAAYLRIKLEAFSVYSGGDIKCACCGERGIPFLTLDHINGDGAAHRKEVMGGNGYKSAKLIGGNGFAYWLKKNGWPKGLQVLCANCNFAKRTGPCCPHQLQKESVS